MFADRSRLQLRYPYSFIRKLGAFLSLAAMLGILFHGFFHPGYSHNDDNIALNDHSSCRYCAEGIDFSTKSNDSAGPDEPEHSHHCALCSIYHHGLTLGVDFHLTCTPGPVNDQQTEPLEDIRIHRDIISRYHAMRAPPAQQAS